MAIESGIFKIGDKVQLLSQPVGNLVIGQICTVNEIVDKGIFGVVEVPNYPYMTPHCWKLIKSMKKTHLPEFL